MPVRLQKVMAHAGIASRRMAEQMIREGRVSVNNKIVTKLGTKVDTDKDEIKVDGRLIARESSKVYLALNKPRGYLTTLKDERKRPIVSDLLKGVPERVFPVGRLDYDSEGLLLLTNDGDFAYRVQHPAFEVAKTYLVKVRGCISNEKLEIIRNGVTLDDGAFKPAYVAIEKLNPKSTWLELIIHEGRNRIIRRYFDSLGHPVARLVRISIGNITLGNLEQGECKYLAKRDVQELLAMSR